MKERRLRVLYQLEWIFWRQIQGAFSFSSSAINCIGNCIGIKSSQEVQVVTYHQKLQ